MNEKTFSLSVPADVALRLAHVLESGNPEVYQAHNPQTPNEEAYAFAAAISQAIYQGLDHMEKEGMPGIRMSFTDVSFYGGEK